MFELTAVIIIVITQDQCLNFDYAIKVCHFIARDDLGKGRRGRKRV